MNLSWLPDETLKFSCQGSGKCCTSRGEYGYVYLTLDDRRTLARHLKIATRDFTLRYCEKKDGKWHLRDVSNSPDCLFLVGNKCGVYSARPTQCRTWPFWPELMNAKAWRREVARFCPGVGRGRTFTQVEIEERVAEQAASEAKL